MIYAFWCHWKKLAKIGQLKLGPRKEMISNYMGRLALRNIKNI